MTGLFKTITGFLTYKEKQNKELGFELLEDSNEGNEESEQEKNNFSQQEEPGDKAAGNKSEEVKPQEAQNKKNTSKRPVPVKVWRSGKKDETVNKQQDSNDNLAAELNTNLENIKQKIGFPQNQDFAIRQFKIGRKLKAFIVYIEEMIDNKTLNLSIFPQLMAKDVLEDLEEESPVDYLIENVLTVHNLRRSNTYNDTTMGILSGQSALFIDGCSESILIETKGFEKRSVEKPVVENVVMGPQEAFTENLRTNLALVRRIIKNENLMIKTLHVGNTNSLSCAVLYIDGIANMRVIEEVEKRIKRINTDFILGSGMIEQFIEDNSFGIWPQVLTTERPDRTASFLIQGQVVIIGDGTPFAITVPVTFFSLFHTSEDTFLRWPLGNFLRLVRLIGFYFALLLPGLYVAMVLYHPEMIPTELLNSIAQSKESVPFPTLAEVLFMEAAFELIREGGIRIPSMIGQTLGIVGALILGQAAVAANLVSPVLIIIVAVDGLCNFAIPNYNLALCIRIEKFLLIFAGAFLGFYGLSLLIFLAGCITCSMKSFGVPFLSPSGPKTKVNRDVVMRGPIWTQKNRPDYLNTPNRKRQGNNVKMWISEKNKGNEGDGDKK